MEDAVITAASLEKHIAMNQELDLLQAFETVMATEKIAQEELKYIAGYVAKQISQDKSLRVYTPSLPHKPNNDWICHLSKGYLKYPSEKLLTAARIINTEYENYHGATFSRDPQIF
ncbi:uncharacterized protein LOC117167675 [Belonocnema kinseyi]|uniref:uncharacterized protein LOC117167675 n=1 Tax=Belonocnema kinseyi TaxID=2817044 RepID=UPI00143D1D70|nr:uncharacterized protein LOC117167675 [Belonocnema kinseyi]